MKKPLRKLWGKMNEPKAERTLIVLLPCFAILIAALILAPRVAFFVKEAADSHIQDVRSLPALPTVRPSPLPTVEPTLQPSADPTSPPTPIASLYPIKDTPINEVTIPDAFEVFMEKRGASASGLYKIGGKLHYFNELHEPADKLGIDVSVYNHGIDWPAVKEQGIDFAIIRVGGRGWESGLIYNDSFFVHNLVEAKKAGIDVGLYFFSTAVNAAEAMEEANYTVHMLKGMDLEYPIFIDVEQSGDYPDGRSDRLDKATRALVIDTFCTQVRKLGYQAGVYSGVIFYKYYMDYANASKYTVWLAGYSRSNHLPYFDWRYDIWQYTDSGIVYGIQSPVDMNVIYE